ncbi:D-alanine-D-alanine ligase [Alteromonadaceae bacterium 2753L.S.0a.02]|nr:D-alanine-D-alanine ligase [Alteromonadaceae bacterium 2753L.S.0a.02]
MSNRYDPKFREYLAAGNSFGRVAVLYGGTSAERDVSLKSGKAISQGLREQGIDVLELDIGVHGVRQILDAEFERAFIALHGAGGEDGKIQALLQLLGIPFTGSLHTASAIAMDKLKTKLIWLSAGIPTPEYTVLNNGDDFDAIISDLGGSVFVKPVHEGSSIGMQEATTAGELAQAFEIANKYDREVMAERTIVGKEFTVAILKDTALPPIQLISHNRFYDYDAKYVSNETEYLCPCGLSEAKTSELQALALQAFKIVGCQGWGRVDALQDEAGEFYLLEVNTVPGMTDHSLVPMAAKASGLSFSELVTEILLQTVER